MRRRLLATALLAWLPAAAQPEAPAPARVSPPPVVGAERIPTRIVVDKVVASVGNRPITLSEVELELRLERAAAGDVEGARGPVSAQALADLLAVLYDRTIVLRGLRNQYPDLLEPQAAERELQRMRDAFPSDEAWESFLARLELSEDEVRERRRRVLEATRILDAAVRDELTVRREDIEQYLAEHPGASREEAERELMAREEANVRARILKREEKDLQASVVDPIVPKGSP